MKNSVQQLVSSYPIVSDQIKKPALQVVLSQLQKTLTSDTAGDIVEFGCYIGTTSLFMRRLLNAHAAQSAPGAAERVLHVYDSFEGLPPKAQQDNSVVGADFKAGELTVSKKQLLTEFAKARLQPPIVHKGWFNQLTDKDVPAQIAFAFLDGDFYTSILDSLTLVWPRLSPGGIVCFDDYGREALPGVERAVRDYFQGAPPAVSVAHNIGVIQKGRG